MHKLPLIALGFLACLSCSHKETAPKEDQIISSLRQIDSEVDNFKFELHAGKMDTELMQGKLEEHSRTLQSFAESLKKAETASQKLAREEVKKLQKQWEQAEKSQSEFKKSISELQQNNKSVASALDTIEKELSRLRSDIANLSSGLQSMTRIVGGQGQTITYYVRAGDSLGHIAKKYDTSVEQIKKVNNLSRDTIYVGQKLSIPKKPSS